MVGRTYVFALFANQRIAGRTRRSAPAIRHSEHL